MYVHIGGTYSLSSHAILAVLDLDEVTARPASSPMLSWLADMDRQLRVDIISEELPRSVVITAGRVYLSPVSTATLRRRLVLAENA